MLTGSLYHELSFITIKIGYNIFKLQECKAEAIWDLMKSHFFYGKMSQLHKAHYLYIIAFFCLHIFYLGYT